ncbi:MAG: 50S ribosomal protein L10 [Ruthenibacterium sp.]
MPSEKILTEKQALVAALREKLSGSVAGVIVDYKGISVVNDTKLRAELREAGVEYSVIKNTMLRLAVKDTALEGMTEQMTGSSAIAISKEDPTAAAKILNKYAESSKGAFALKAGYMEGKVMDVPSIVAIANLPNREGMLSMLLSALTGNLRGLAVGLKAVADKKAAEEAA